MAVVFDKRNTRAWSMAGPSGVLGLASCEIAKENSNFAILTSDLCSYSGLGRFKKLYPGQLYNVGIAEQNMVAMAAGMASEGMDVFAVTYAAFASARALDQVKLCMGYMKQAVKLAGLSSGFTSGILGATHMCIEDIAIMRAIPDIAIFSPADTTETMKVLLTTVNMQQPVYIRICGVQRMPVVFQDDYLFKPGKAVQLKKGQDVCIMATGPMVVQSLRAARKLEEDYGISCTVWDFHTIRPIDKDVIMDSCKYKLIVTAEEHNTTGGFGSAVSEVLSLCKERPRQLFIGVDGFYPHAASYNYLLEQCGLLPEQVAERIKTFLEEN